MHAPFSDTIHSGYIVRRAQTPDIEAVMRLAEAVPTSARWSHAAYSAYCVAESSENVSQRKALFVTCVPTSIEIIGFAAFSAVAFGGTGECELENMAVTEEWRRHGIGRRLLAAGMLWCRAWRLTPVPADGAESPGAPTGSGLWLEVRASNHGAIAFYENAGFTIAGRRPSYYTQPTEDAILMQKSVRCPAGSLLKSSVASRLTSVLVLPSI
jgi:ribosomal-protein-alanine N-acetyltransferase